LGHILLGLGEEEIIVTDEAADDSTRASDTREHEREELEAAGGKEEGMDNPAVCLDEEEGAIIESINRRDDRSTPWRVREEGPVGWKGHPCPQDKDE
jgi:hypothetical protein